MTDATSYAIERSDSASNFPRGDRQRPAENGRRIGTIERSADEQIRVNWSEFEGKPFVSLRLWRRGDDGGWWPDGKRGMSVRIRELPDLAAAIAEALDLAEANQRHWREQQASRPAPRCQAEESWTRQPCPRRTGRKPLTSSRSIADDPTPNLPRHPPRPCRSNETRTRTRRNRRRGRRLARSSCSTRGKRPGKASITNGPRPP